MAFNVVSINGTERPVIQIGDSGGIEASGYTSYFGLINASPAFSTSTTYMGLTTAATAGSTFNGIVTLQLLDATNFIWAMNFVLAEYLDVGYISIGGAAKTLSAELDRVRLTTSGSDTFDAGSVNITYE
jgi:hypothetical protein